MSGTDAITDQKMHQTGTEFTNPRPEPPVSECTGIRVMAERNRDGKIAELNAKVSIIPVNRSHRGGEDNLSGALVIGARHCHADRSDVRILFEIVIQRPTNTADNIMERRISGKPTGDALIHLTCEVKKADCEGAAGNSDPQALF